MRGFTHGARVISSGNRGSFEGGRGLTIDIVSGRLLIDIKNLVIAHKIFPVEAYVFPQKTVAGFWKQVFEEKEILVFGSEEVPEDVNVLQTEFVLPDKPPSWLLPEED